jgi:hypothetical protein
MDSLSSTVVTVVSHGNAYRVNGTKDLVVNIDKL